MNNRVGTSPWVFHRFPTRRLAAKTSLHGLNCAADVDVSLDKGTNFLACVLHCGVIPSPEHPSDLREGMLGVGAHQVHRNMTGTNELLEPPLSLEV